jgi:pimeloyl-ACP methyl ester carboxylesterase
MLDGYARRGLDLAAQRNEAQNVQRIDLDGTVLAYSDRGSGSPVLFIHGSGAYSEMVEPVLDELPDGVRAIAYDRRGFGASPGRLARRLGEHVDEAASLLQAVDAVPATIVGSSSGGVLALRLAVARPELVKALVLIEPAYQMAVVPSASASAALARVHLRWALRRDPEGAALHLYRWTTRYESGGNQFDAYPERWRRTALGHARTALNELMQVAMPAPPRSALRQITKPTAVLIGDTGLPVFHRTARRALRAIPGAREVPVPGAAHLVYTDQPAACAAAIAEVAGVVGESPAR